MQCALKACIARQIREHEFPDKKLVNDSYVHDLSKLLNVSGVKQEHEKEQQSNPEFATNWAVVKDWSEQSRYQHSVAKTTVKDFFAAVNDPRNGVLPWLRMHW